MDRRRFLKSTAAGGALISIGVTTPGCGNPVTPAPLAKVTTNTDMQLPLTIKNALVFDAPINAAYGTIQLLVEYYPQLAATGGAITLELGSEIQPTNNRGYSVPINNTILVINQPEGVSPPGFIALQSSCPHAACPLGYNDTAKLIECPCHGSRFFSTKDNNQCVGGVDHAPAKQGLQQWQTSVETVAGGNRLLTIDLKTTLPCECLQLPALDAMMKLTLPLATFPQLSMVGGAVCGQPSGSPNPLSIVRLDASTVIAVDAKCTHLGCTVAWNGDNRDFECPCHGSTFASDGSVKVGPATVPLKSYSVDVTADSIVVTIT
ncbi:MAG TPA: Rieske 2Fe-2S domain-containing protein [Polyangia bacterium]|nr:Rieske 2Fe-2S domain-containing protein [Polyangia bacterium]